MPCKSIDLFYQPFDHRLMFRRLAPYMDSTAWFQLMLLLIGGGCTYFVWTHRHEFPLSLMIMLLSVASGAVVSAVRRHRNRQRS